MKPQKLDLIVFDLDGTIADTAPEIQVCLNQALACHGLSPYSIEEVKGFIGNGARVLSERALRGRWPELIAAGKCVEEISPEMMDTFFADLMVFYRQIDNQHTVLYDGVREFLQSPPVPLALLTNKPTEPTHLFLRHFELDKAFCVVVTGESAPRPKPDPQGMRQIIQQMNTVPERTLMVGDGAPDIEVAKAAGTKSCALTQGFTPTDVLRNLQPDWMVPTFAAFVALASSQFF